MGRDGPRTALRFAVADVDCDAPPSTGSSVTVPVAGRFVVLSLNRSDICEVYESRMMDRLRHASVGWSGGMGGTGGASHEVEGLLLA